MEPYNNYKNTPINKLGMNDLVPNDLFYPPPPNGNECFRKMALDEFKENLEQNPEFASKWIN